MKQFSFRDHSLLISEVGKRQKFYGVSWSVSIVEGEGVTMSRIFFMWGRECGDYKIVYRTSFHVVMKHTCLLNLKSHIERENYVLYNLQLLLYQYHPTSELMQILHFNWICYWGTITNTHRVVKFAASFETCTKTLADAPC